MSDQDTQEIVSRLEDSLKTPYPSDGKLWSALIETLADEIYELEEAREKVVQGKFVTDAQGEQLSRLGELFGIERRSNEERDVFRARLQVALRSQITSATVSEIENAVAVLLEANVEDIRVREPFNLAPASMNIDIPDEYLFNSDLSDTQFVTIVRSVVAAGVDIAILVTEEQEAKVILSDEAEVGPDAEVLESLLGGDAGFIDPGREKEDTVSIEDVAVTDDENENVDTTGLDDRGRLNSHEVGSMRSETGEWNVDAFSMVLDEFEKEFTGMVIIEDDPSEVQVDSVSTMYSQDGKWNVDSFGVDPEVITEAIQESVALGDDSRVGGDEVGLMDSHHGRWNVDAFNMPDEIVKSLFTECLSVADSTSIQTDLVGGFDSSIGRWNVDVFNMPLEDIVELLTEGAAIDDSSAIESDSIGNMSSEEGRWNVDVFQVPLTEQLELHIETSSLTDGTSTQSDEVSLFTAGEGRWNVDRFDSVPIERLQETDEIPISDTVKYIEEEVKPMTWNRGRWGVDYTS